jgi:hypothetical protein
MEGTSCDNVLIMEEFVDKIRSKYCLDLGDGSFSPLTESSLGLALLYIDDFDRKVNQSPLCLCFPKKDYAAIWISVGLLRNLFLRDYIYQTNNRIDELGIKKGDYIEIFGCCIQYLGFNERIELKFRDGNMNASKNVLPYINTTLRNRLNKIDLFKSKRRSLLSNRNAVSKILDQTSDLVVNPKNLTAQVLLITGRGNVKHFRDELRNVEVYGESLSSIFLENVNLIIKTDLEEYVNILSESKTKDSETFVLFFNDAYKRISESNPDFEEDFNELKKLVDKGEVLTNEFYNLFDEIIGNFSIDEYPYLENLKELYPGVLEQLPQNLRAVVINDISLVDSYQKTINGFLKSKIPVIIISDRQVQEKEDIRFYDTFFNLHPEYNRINFNKSKINAIKVLSDRDDFLDNNLWDTALKYSTQEVSIKIFKSTCLDNFLPKVQKAIKELEGFELLKKAYYCFFQPAAYVVKNSHNGYNTIEALVKEFEQEFANVKDNIYTDYKNLIEEGIKLLKGGDVNTKYYDCNNNLHVTQLSVPNGDKICIPADVIKGVNNNMNCSSITFTGFPLNEFLGKSLINAVNSIFVPKVNVLCWPNEGKLTYQYLRNRVLSGYFNDKLSEGWSFPKELLLSNAQDFQLEVEKCLKLEQSIEHISEGPEHQENDLFEISTFRYNGFQKEVNRGASYKVSCKIVDFEDNSFMFLPKNSKVLSQLESENGQIRFRNSSFNELKKGLRIYKYGKDRTDQRVLARSVPALESSFDDLEEWRNCLTKLYNECSRDLNFLEEYLQEIKIDKKLTGNPTKQNVQRWLFDDEIHSPEKDNLILIYNAAGMSSIDENVTKILDAKRNITNFNRTIDSHIKRELTNRLSISVNTEESVFNLNIYGISVQVESKVISGLQNLTFEADYYNTRKFLN